MLNMHPGEIMVKLQVSHSDYQNAYQVEVLLFPWVAGVLLGQVDTVWGHLQCWHQLQLPQPCHGLEESSPERKITS